MENVDSFKQAAIEIASEFSKLDKKENIKVVSHLDTDGICAASVLVDALHKENRKYSITILPQLKESDLEQFSKDSASVFMFTDLGSGQLESIAKHLREKKVFVLDHHVPEAAVQGKNVFHLNPCIYGIDGSTEISGSGVVYTFAKALTKSNKMAHIALIGAIGDSQEREKFSGLNMEILQDAMKEGTISITKGIKFFGLQTRPLHKLLQYGSDIIVPGVTGDEKGSLQFLASLGIEAKAGNKWKKLKDLSEEEKKRLIHGIIGKRVDLPNADEIFCNVYILKREDENSPLREAKEFSTLLNACGRLGKASLGIGACLNDEHMKTRAIETLYEYKRAILDAMLWYTANKNNAKVVIKKPGYVIINAQHHILSTIIGTMASIIAKGNEFPPGYYILSLAQNGDLTTKISLRVSGNHNGENLQVLMKKILSKLSDGAGGGHMHAAGGLIPTEKEEEFLEAAKDVLDELMLEEDVE